MKVNRLHGVVSQKMKFFTTTAVVTSDPASFMKSCVTGNIAVKSSDFRTEVIKPEFQLHRFQYHTCTLILLVLSCLILYLHVI
jgi:hypothetical protein